MAAGEQVVPASELAAAMKQIKELQRLLGKKTMENELLKEAVDAEAVLSSSLIPV
ncbi:insertion sequence 2 OrfA protein [Escherichia coli WV_060327]|nr:insertion sequence 2 OrfA protein [Escherichia coli WV_060327]